MKTYRERTSQGHLQRYAAHTEQPTDNNFFYNTQVR
jgi:hypothetical protein